MSNTSAFRILKKIGFVFWCLVAFLFTVLIVVNCIGIHRLSRVYYFFVEEYPSNPPKELRLIGCGWSRTATLSIKQALEEEFGYKVYHGSDVVFHAHSRQWVEAFETEEGLDSITEEILRLGFDAIIDFPASILCMKLSKKYPKAKVLLTIRDSSEKWFKSFSTLCHLHSLFISEVFPLLFMKGTHYFELMPAMMNGINVPLEFQHPESIIPWKNRNFVDAYSSILYNEEHIKKMYEEWIDRVNTTISPQLKERFLIFNVKQGWEQLAKFVGVDVPEKPFPHANHGAILRVFDFLMRLLIIIHPLITFFDFVIFMWVIKLFFGWWFSSNKVEKKTGKKID